jgi:hypothetical protein
MLPEEEVRNFKPKLSGRPRKSIARWRSSPGDNTLHMTQIWVSVRNGQMPTLLRRLEEMRRNEQHIFPGTVSRYIASSETSPEHIEISLTWRSYTTPTRAEQEKALEAFQQDLADVLDWNMARYSHSKILLHT